MKTLISLFLIISPFWLFGQNEEKFELKRNVLKIAPQQFRVKSLKLGIERFNGSFSKSYSLYVTIRKDKSNQIQFPTGFDGLGGEFQYRVYLKPLTSYQNRKGKAYDQGIYLSGYIQGNAFGGDQLYRYTLLDQTSGNYYFTDFYTHEDIGNWGTGFTIGLQRVFWKILSVDVYVGGGIQWSDVVYGYNGFPNSLPINSVRYMNRITDFSDPIFQGILPKVGAHLGIAL